MGVDIMINPIDGGDVWHTDRHKFSALAEGTSWNVVIISTNACHISRYIHVPVGIRRDPAVARRLRGGREDEQQPQPATSRGSEGYSSDRRVRNLRMRPLQLLVFQFQESLSTSSKRDVGNATIIDARRCAAVSAKY